MLEAALSTSPVVTRLLVGALVRPQKHVSRAPPCRRNMLARALCITISDDRGDESFADDLNMGRGIVSGRVALLLRSTEIRPHRPNDLLPPSNSQTPGWLPFHTPHSTLGQKNEIGIVPGRPGTGPRAGTLSNSTLGQKTRRDWASRRDTLKLHTWPKHASGLGLAPGHSQTPHLAKKRVGTGPRAGTLSNSTLGQNTRRDWASRRDTLKLHTWPKNASGLGLAPGHSQTPHLAKKRVGTGPRAGTLSNSTLGQNTRRDWASRRDTLKLHTWPKNASGLGLAPGHSQTPHLAKKRVGTGPRAGTLSNYTLGQTTPRDSLRDRDTPSQFRYRNSLRERNSQRDRDTPSQFRYRNSLRERNSQRDRDTRSQFRYRNSPWPHIKIKRNSNGGRDAVIPRLLH